MKSEPTPSRLKKLLADPVGVLKSRLRWLGQLLRYRLPGGYRSRAYWTSRLGRYGFDLRGVGCDSLSDAENRRMYAQAREQFLTLVGAQGVDLTAARVLDVGCGTGFYADLCAQAGCSRYVGLDITDTLLPELRRRLPAFTFRQLDITEPAQAAQDWGGPFDLVLMIDVTQHITQDDRFTRAMQTIRASLAAGAVFIVTSWLDALARRSFFERSRDLAAYQAEFPGYRFSPPQRFRDKFIFAVRMAFADK
jgi:SAM-dependent methyltransferase